MVELDKYVLDDSHEWVREAARFADEDLASLPGVNVTDPWSAASLRDAEAALLVSPTRADDPELRTAYTKFLGEGLVRKFGGRWAILPGDLIGDTSAGEAYGVSYAQAAAHIDVVSSMVPLAVSFMSGQHWASIFETTSTVLQRVAGT